MYKLLCLEDDEISALIMEKFLQKEFEVEIFNDCSSFYQAIQIKKFDALILDIGLRDEDADGVGVMQAIRQMPKGEEMKIIAATAFASPKDRRRFLQAGFDECISKPVSKVVLLNTINEVITKQTAYAS